MHMGRWITVFWDEGELGSSVMLFTCFFLLKTELGNILPSRNGQFSCIRRMLVLPRLHKIQPDFKRILFLVRFMPINVNEISLLAF